MPKISKDENKCHTSHPTHKTLTAYRDDQLSDEIHSQVQKHVSSCVSCRKDFLDMCNAV